MTPLINAGGVTIKELKELIKDWPEEYKNGDPTEVWIETDQRTSNVCKAVWPLNLAVEASDIILS